MKDRHSGLQMDPAPTLKRSNRSISLRNTHRIYNKWGLKYHAAVRDAVFGRHSIPFVPLEPPASLKYNSGEPDLVYVCQQCKDCFWFKSSFEDHSKRHSWILGYWCQKCFLTVCTHLPNNNSQCEECAKVERDKRMYMKKRGIVKHQKMGAIRVFYNQCQFFAHLKLHNRSLVDICDIMLMPLPNMEGDWIPEMDIACEALLEYCFMIKVHVMDWLRAKKVDCNWWQLVKSNIDDDSNPVRKILETYNARELFDPDRARVDADLVPLNSLYKTNLKSSNIGHNKMMSGKHKKSNKKVSNAIMSGMSDQNMEDEDNPCGPNDITFVDCGPTHKYYIYDPLTDYSLLNNKVAHSKYVQYMDNGKQSTSSQACKKQNRKKTLKKESVNYINAILPSTEFSAQKLEKDSSYVSKDLVYKCNNNNAKLSNMAQNGTLESAIEKTLSKNSNLLPNLSHKSIISQEYLKKKYSSFTKSDPNLLAFQSGDSEKVNALITQIPSHLFANNKIVLIGQDSGGINKRINRIALDGKSQEKDTKTVSAKLVPLRVSNSTISEDNKNNDNMKKVVVESNKTKVHQIPIEGKVVYQNGRRYIITHTSNNLKSQSSLSTTPNSSSNTSDEQCNTQKQNGVITKSASLENLQQFNSSETNVSLPTPSPSSSELSNISSCEAHKKQTFTSNCCVQKNLELCKNNVKFRLKHSIFDLLNDDVLCETLSFYRAHNEELYLNIKRSKKSTQQLNVVTTVTFSKYRQDMLNEFRQLTCPELKERILHLQDVRAEIMRVMNFADDKDIENTLESTRTLQRALEDALKSCSHESEETKDVWNDEDASLDEWETDFVTSGSEFRCATCSKIMKPKSYIPGFSKPAEDESMYCSCYKHFCHECHSYQGNVTRFLSHQHFHEKERPYACPDCFQRFPSFKLLEGHTWSRCFHMLKKRVFYCKICQIDGFQDTESITRHFAIMHSSKKIACEICYMVLDTYSEYKKHRDKAHSTVLKSEPIRLIICKLGQCINRREKYMSHLERHYGIRKTVWLKCPFCPYYNIEGKKFVMQFRIHFQIIHLNRLAEIINPETLKDILPRSLSKCLFKDDEFVIYDEEETTNSGKTDEKVCSDDTVVPKIINTRTIPSEDFERVSEIIGNDSINCKNTKFVKVSSKDGKEDDLPKILDVRSMADILAKDLKLLSKTDHSRGIIKENKDIKPNIGTDKTRKLESLSQDRPKKKANSTKTMMKDDLSYTENGIVILEDDEKLNDTLLGSSENNLTVVKDKDTPKETCNKSEIPSTTDVTEITEDVDSIPKPPPLSRIPQHVLDNGQPNETKKTKKKKLLSHTNGNREKSCKRPWRIALNGPTNSKEEHQDYSCHLCGELINTSWPVISNHFRTEHSDECKLCIVTPRLLRITPEFIDHGYKDLFNNKKRKSEGTVPMSKKRRRWTARKHSDSNNSFGLGLCVERESVEDGEGNFVCRKCDQRCTNMSNLKEHIASNHRIKGRYLVCLECGENFVVAPSLQMHLKAFHGIEDPISYMNQNSSYAPHNIDDLENETKAVIANQCYVCMAVFEDKATVDKHLRVHGMAFLNRKRIEAQNALKSTETNLKIAENKESPPKKSTKESPVKRDNPSNTILEKINATILEEIQ